MSFSRTPKSSRSRAGLRKHFITTRPCGAAGTEPEHFRRVEFVRAAMGDEDTSFAEPLRIAMASTRGFLKAATHSSCVKNKQEFFLCPAPECMRKARGRGMKGCKHVPAAGLVKFWRWDAKTGSVAGGAHSLEYPPESMDAHGFVSVTLCTAKTYADDHRERRGPQSRVANRYRWVDLECEEHVAALPRYYVLLAGDLKRPTTFGMVQLREGAAKDMTRLHEYETSLVQWFANVMTGRQTAVDMPEYETNTHEACGGWQDSEQCTYGYEWQSASEPPQCSGWQCEQPQQFANSALCGEGMDFTDDEDRPLQLPPCKREDTASHRRGSSDCSLSVQQRTPPAAFRDCSLKFEQEDPCTTGMHPDAAGAGWCEPEPTDRNTLGFGVDDPLAHPRLLDEQPQPEPCPVVEQPCPTDSANMNMNAMADLSPLQTPFGLPLGLPPAAFCPLDGMGANMHLDLDRPLGFGGEWSPRGPPPAMTPPHDAEVWAPGPGLMPYRGMTPYSPQTHTSYNYYQW